MKNIEWWRTAANHMWRTYFAILRGGYVLENLSDPNKKIYSVCHSIFQTNFIKTDQEILQMYYTTKWGEDKSAVEDYSVKNNIPEKIIWMVIRRANRTVMEKIGLLERKEDGCEE